MSDAHEEVPRSLGSIPSELAVPPGAAVVSQYDGQHGVSKRVLHT
jgi:hypothetical protein